MTSPVFVKGGSLPNSQNIWEEEMFEVDFKYVSQQSYRKLSKALSTEQRWVYTTEGV